MSVTCIGKIHAHTPVYAGIKNQKIKKEGKNV